MGRGEERGVGRGREGEGERGKERRGEGETSWKRGEVRGEKVIEEEVRG